MHQLSQLDFNHVNFNSLINLRGASTLMGDSWSSLVISKPNNSNSQFDHREWPQFGMKLPEQWSTHYNLNLFNIP